MSLSILALNCTLKPQGPSSTQKLLELALAEFGPEARHEILRETDSVRGRAMDAIGEFLDRVVPVSAPQPAQ